MWNGTGDGMKSSGMELKKEEDNPPLNAKIKGTMHG